MTCTSNKKGVAIIELLATTVMIGMIMLTIGSVTYFVYHSYTKIGNQSNSNIAAVIITQSVMYEVNNFAPQSVANEVTTPEGSRLSDWKTLLCSDANSQTCIIYERFSYNEVVLDGETGNNIIDTINLDGTINTVEPCILKIEILENNVGKSELHITKYYSTSPCVERTTNSSGSILYLNASKFVLDEVNTVDKIVDLNGMELDALNSLFEVTNIYNEDDSSIIEYFLISYRFKFADPSVEIPFSGLVLEASK